MSELPPPTYPVKCPECGLMYGPGSKVQNHRPGSMNCIDRIRPCPECGTARTCRACKHDQRVKA